MRVPQIDLPISITTRPSTGEKLEVRPYTSKEEKILLIAAASKDKEQIARAIKQIIDNCVLTQIKGTWTATDVEWIFIYLRTISVSDVVELSMKVPSCEVEDCPKSIDAIMDLKEAKVGNMDGDKFVEFKANKKNATHKISITKEVGIELRFPSAEVLSLYKDENDQWDLTKQEQLVYDCVVSLYDNDGVYLKDQDFDFEFFVNNFYDKLLGKQKDEIARYLNGMPTTHCKVKAYCTKCKKKEERTINGITSFFDLSMVTKEA